MAVMMVRIVVALLAVWAMPAQAHLYIARLCRGFTCTDTNFPILDWDPKKAECVCHRNPCWNQDGNLHSCPMVDHPFLTYNYDKDGKLSCGCREDAFYVPVHLARDLCAGSQCDTPEHPVLDYDEQSRQCVCRSHPCWDQAGVHHSCKGRQTPILRYREDITNGAIEGKCECIPRLEQPVQEKVDL